MIIYSSFIFILNVKEYSAFTHLFFQVKWSGTQCVVCFTYSKTHRCFVMATFVILVFCSQCSAENTTSMTLSTKNGEEIFFFFVANFANLKQPQPAKQHNRAVVHHRHHIYCTSFSVFSKVPSSAQTHVNKACDGMSAREVWSRAGSRATALCGVARLRHSLPSCQILLPKTHQPSLILPRSLLLLARSRLHLLRWNGPRLLPPRCVFFRHLVLRWLGAAPEADVTSPESAGNRKQQPPSPSRDNPCLK